MILELAEMIRHQLGLRRAVDLIWSDQRWMPMTWGSFRPVILLPYAARHWSRERLRVVLLHEMAHVRRWDCLSQMLLLMVRACYWFHPLVWWMSARARWEQELACDDIVLSAGTSAPDYAEHLLEVSTGYSTRSLLSGVTLAVGRTIRLQRRLLAMLDSKRNHRPPHRGWVAFLAMLLLAILIPLGALSFSAQAQEGKAGEAAAEDPAPPEIKFPTGELEELLKKHYGKSLDNDKLREGMIKGILEQLNDPFAGYLTPDELKHIHTNLRGSFFGIGAQLGMKEGRLMILAPLVGSPAKKAGVRAGEEIIAVDGKPVKDLSLQDSVYLIIGKEGTPVKLTLRSEGKERELSIKRGRIEIPSVQGIQRGPKDQWQHVLDAKNKVGYIRITNFSSTTTDEVKKVLADLKTKGAKGLLLDLRGAPGGLLSAAVETADLFLNDGVIVSVKGKDMEREFKATKEGTFEDIPILVLVDDRTASASEILAGALQDHDRALVLGDRTFGKGSVQAIFSLEKTGGALKLTTARFYLPKGRSLDKSADGKEWGVDPDDGYYISLSQEELEKLTKSQQDRNLVSDPNHKPIKDLTPETIKSELADPQLAAALTTMVAKLTKGSYIKVGKGKEEIEKQVHAKTRLLERRAELLKELEAINQKLQKEPEVKKD